MSTSFSPRETKVDTITGATSIKNDDTGTTFILNAAGGAAVTLPAPEAGLNYKFIVGAAFATTDWTIVTESNATIIQGAVLVNGAVVPGADEDTITFAAAAESVGDYVDLISDGTNWYVSGAGAVAASITLTDAA